MLLEAPFARAASSISGPNPICPNATNTWSVITTGTPTNYTWTISTNSPNTAGASILGSVSNATVDVAAVFGGTFTLECILNLDGTNELASANITVTGPPGIACPGDISVSCFRDVPAPDTTLVTTTGAVYTVFLNDVATTNGCSTTILRYYAAVSSCSSTSICAQTITVQNTNGPIFHGLTNRTVECGSAWDFDTPVATDFCSGDPNVLFLGAVGGTTNVICGSTIGATRIWMALDLCTNMSMATQTVTVVDTIPPVFAGVSNLTFECGAAWDFQAPTASDVCSGTNVNILVFSTLTNPACGNTFSATRLWQALDECTNAAWFSQTVTILDTTPPVFTGVSNLTFECGSAWNFQPPSASDNCVGTNVSLSIVSTTTNHLCGSTIAATRVWQAADPCTNVAMFAQTVTIVDTTSPSLVCVTNRTVECGQPWTFDPPAVSDTCEGTNVTIIVSGTVTNPLAGGAFIATRTWKATDSCSNSSFCSQTVSVLDRTPPVIVCPPNMIVAEAPHDSGGAAVTFPLPTVSDNCDTAPQLISSPANGSVFPIGTNTVTWTAIDGSGNSNSCTFTVRVIPYRLFVVTNTDNAGPGSLRQAMLDANDAPGENLILFTLPGGGFKTIHLDSALPDITSPVIIDGWSQSGSNQPPVIALDGTATSNSADGLVIRSGNTTVRGLAIYGFVNGIRIDGAGANTIQGNYLGADLTGTNAPGNSGDGILLNSDRNHIGGLTAGTGNLICGNAGNGITLATTNCSNNLIEGNYIGLAANSQSALGNFGAGILTTTGAFRNFIGGTADNSGNQIKFNGGAGVALTVDAGNRNPILGNAIFSNGGLGIDLGNDGITANDSDDLDTGANDLQNFPILTDARSVAGQTTFEGTLTSIPNNTYRIEFFLNNTPDPSGNGEGQIYLGSTTVLIHGNGQGFLTTFPITLVYTQYITATATDPLGNTSEFSPAIQVRTPPVIEAQPSSTNITDGSTVTLCANASGTPPIRYQWRLNGVNIAGATNSCYTIPAASVDDGGIYTVIIGNDLGAFATADASLLLSDTNIINLPISDNFTNAVELSPYGNGTNGILAGDNSLATLEPMEPLHAGLPGGKSVWYHWCTPNGNGGIATFRTSGSTFDTVMAVYQGGSLTNLVAIASDDDGGKFYSSEVRFNAFFSSSPNKDNCYYIAIDGLAGKGGPFVLSWNEIKTPHMLPVILSQPTPQTVPQGGTAVFTNMSVPECSSGHLDCNNTNHWDPNGGQKEKLTYQWYYEDSPLTGQTNYSLIISNVQPQNVGNYHVRVFTPWQFLDSKTVALQINDTGDSTENVQAVDKFEYLDFFANSLVLGEPGSLPHGAASGSSDYDSAATVVRGYSGSQVFNTVGAASTPGEIVCGVPGGCSEWVSIIAEANGILMLNTDGSSYDTVMAAFKRSPTNASILLQLNCDNNGGTNGRTSSMNFAVSGGTTNYILVDGVNGASGTLRLNYSLATGTILTPAGRTLEGANQIQVNGRANLRFTLQASSDLATWTSILTTTMTNSILTYTDLGSIGQTKRYYRALILP